jgi:putative hemolysin
MGGLGVEVTVVLALIAFNGVLAMAEMAIVASRTARLKQRSDSGDAGASVALELVDQPNRFLSTVQIGITLVGILAGAFGGATLASKLGEALEPSLGQTWSGVVSVAAVVAIITYLSLIFGELVPKRLALQHPEPIASSLARPLRILSVATAPAVALLSGSTQAVLRLIGVRNTDEPRVSEEEVRLLLEEGRRAGIFEPAEEEMVAGVFRLGDRVAADIMTPRPQVTWIDVEDPLDESLAKAGASGHEQFPVCRGQIDEVLGVVMVRDLWDHARAGGDARQPELMTLVRPALFIPESKPVLTTLEDFKHSRAKLALVVDEFGGIQGVLTLTDVLEEVVGEIDVGAGPAMRPLQQRGDGSWMVDGMLPYDDFRERFGREDEELDGFQTVGGFVMAQLGRVPRAGESFAWQGHRVEVSAMDGKRVARVVVRRLPES